MARSYDAAAAAEQRQAPSRRIPIYVRFVHRDNWLRMHVDLRSTVGSVKDAALHRSGVPHRDPSLNVDFYQDMVKEGSSSSSLGTSRSAWPQGAPSPRYPKAFVAAKPKVSDGSKSNSLVASGIVSDPASATRRRRSDTKTDTSRAADMPRSESRTAAATPDVRTREPSSSTAVRPRQLQHSSSASSAASSSRLAAPNASPLVPDRTSSSLGGPAVAGVSSPRLSMGSSRPESIASPSSSPKITARVSSRDFAADYSSQREPQQQTATATPTTMTTRSRGNTLSSSSNQQPTPSSTPPSPGVSEVYLSYLASGLPGNQEAKKLEEEAMRKALGFQNQQQPVRTSSGSSLGGPVTSSPSLPRTPEEHRTPASQRARDVFDSDFDEDDDDDSTSDDDAESNWSVVHDASVGGERSMDQLADTLLASPLLSGEEAGQASTLRTRNKEALWGTQLEEAMGAIQANDGDTMRASRTSPMSSKKRSGTGSSAAERARSRTITAADRVEASFVLASKGSSSASPTPASPPRMTRDRSNTSMTLVRGYSSSAANDFGLSAGSSGSSGGGAALGMMRDSSFDKRAMPSPVRSMSSRSAGVGGFTSGSAPSGAGGFARLAGIRLDEISAWQAPSHPLNRHFAVYSFSNGQLMEDWRTLAALRLRPFEMLEVQLAHPERMIHLPRSGDLLRAAPGSGGKRSVDSGGQRTATGPSFESRYVQPYYDGWHYVLKPRTRSSKMRKEGSGLWKLRWLVVSNGRMTVYRKRLTPDDMGRDAVVFTSELGNIRWVDSEPSEDRPGSSKLPRGTTPGAQLPSAANGMLAASTLTVAFGTTTVTEHLQQYGFVSGQVLVSIRCINQHAHEALHRLLDRAKLKSILGRTAHSYLGLATAWRRRAVLRALAAGLGGTVQPGRAGRRGGRNALLKSHLALAFDSKEDEDADRWSSESEDEVVPISAQFQR